MKNFLAKHKKILIISIFAIVITPILVSFIIDSMKTSTVNILVAPADSIVSINGVNYTNGTFRLFPTENAEITISAPNFETKTFRLDLGANSTTMIHGYLINAETGMNYYSRSQPDYDILKIVADDPPSLDFIKKFEHALSIKQYLPLVEYTDLSEADAIKTHKLSSITEITDGSTNEECQNIICLQVSTNTGNTETAKKLLADKGFNYADYQIIYKEITTL